MVNFIENCTQNVTFTPENCIFTPQNCIHTTEIAFLPPKMPFSPPKGYFHTQIVIFTMTNATFTRKNAIFTLNWYRKISKFSQKYRNFPKKFELLENFDILEKILKFFEEARAKIFNGWAVCKRKEIFPV